MSIVDDLIPEIVELGHDLFVVYDGACQKMREKANKEGVVREAVFTCSSPCGINKVGHLREGEKTNSQRKRDMKQSKIEGRYRIDIRYKKVHVFEVRKKGEVSCNANNKHKTGICGVFPLPDQCRTDCIIEEDTAKYERNVDRIPVTVEEEGSKNEPGLCSKGQLLPVENKIYGKRNREEEKNKCVRIKEHHPYPV